MQKNEVILFLIEAATKHFSDRGVPARTNSKSDASYALGVLPDKLGVSSSPINKIDNERFQEGITMLKKALKHRNKKS